MKHFLRFVHRTLKGVPSRNAAKVVRLRTQRVKELSREPFEEIDKELGVYRGDGKHPDRGYLSPKYYRRQKRLTEAEKTRILGE